MALVKKILTAVGESIALATANEENGAVSFQIPAGGVGTYVLEATLNGIDWIIIQLTNLNTGVVAASANAPGIYYANYLGFFSARVRKTVGVAAEQISLAVNDD